MQGARVARTSEMGKETPEATLRRVIISEFPDTPEGVLYFEILNRAIRDLKVNPRNGTDEHRDKSARNYLTGQIPHVSSLGISSNWIRRKIRQYINIDVRDK
jgi:hypothetical protein